MITSRPLGRAYRYVRSMGGGKRFARHTSFSAALQACETDGYNDCDIADIVVKKTLLYRDSLKNTNEPFCLNSHTALLLCSLLMAKKGNEVHVLDFGGAAGIHYFNMRSMVSKSISMNWVVVETGAMVQQASKYLASSELSFATTIEQSQQSLCRVDLATSSGAIQYLSDPIESVRKLALCGSDYLSFDRLCLTRGGSDIYVTHKTSIAAHGPGPLPSGVQDKVVIVPSVIVQQSAFMNALQERYSILGTQDNDSGVLPIAGENIFGLGLISKKIDV